MSKTRVVFSLDDDLADKVILSVRTKGFESEVEVPIPTTPADLDKFVTSWLDMMHQALKMPHAALSPHQKDAAG